MSASLIVNADDYGRSPLISRGIRYAHLNGIVTSSTCMMSMPGIEEELQLALCETPRLALGVHLLLTTVPPLLPPQDVPTLVNPEGKFRELEPFLANVRKISAIEVRHEWKAQIERFVALTGKRPTHLDAHHHCAYVSETLLRTLVELAGEYCCAIRFPFEPDAAARSLFDNYPLLASHIEDFIPTQILTSRVRRPDTFQQSFYDRGATQENLEKLLSSLPPGISELMCHAGYRDDSIKTSYNAQRENELQILCSPETSALIKRLDISLVNFEECT